MKNLILIVFLLATHSIFSQVLTWESFVDSIPTLSSPRPSDLNNDGILDIIIGGGTEGEYSNSGVMAFDGTDGSLIWKIMCCKVILIFSGEIKSGCHYQTILR